MSTLFIVAACSTRKRLRVPPHRRLGEVGARSLERRASVWGRRLAESDDPSVSAADLYCGGYWSVVRDLPSAADKAGFTARVFVASAGYGLIPASRMVRGYSATFSTRHADSVIRVGETAATPSEVRVAWWRHVNAGSGWADASPWPITRLAQQHPEASVLVVASPPYLDAMSEDLLEARQHLGDPDRLVLVSSRLPKTLRALDDHLVPSGVALRSALKLRGALQSLHARTALDILNERAAHGLSARRLQRTYRDLASAHPAAPMRKGTPASDERVRLFIEEQLADEPAVSKTRTLQRLRQAALACEQHRFARLFNEVREDRYAPTS